MLYRGSGIMKEFIIYLIIYTGNIFDMQRYISIIVCLKYTSYRLLSILYAYHFYHCVFICYSPMFIKNA